MTRPIPRKENTPARVFIISVLDSPNSVGAPISWHRAIGVSTPASSVTTTCCRERSVGGRTARCGSLFSWSLVSWGHSLVLSSRRSLARRGGVLMFVVLPRSALWRIPESRRSLSPVLRETCCDSAPCRFDGERCEADACNIYNEYGVILTKTTYKQNFCGSAEL